MLPREPSPTPPLHPSFQGPVSLIDSDIQGRQKLLVGMQGALFPSQGDNRGGILARPGNEVLKFVVRLVSQAIKGSLSPSRAGQLNEKSLGYCRDRGQQRWRKEREPHPVSLGGQHREIKKGRKDSEMQRENVERDEDCFLQGFSSYPQMSPSSVTCSSFWHLGCPEADTGQGDR